VRSLLLTAVVLLAVGVLLENTDVALLSLMPLTAYALNASLEPPNFVVSRRRVGGAVEVVVESDWRPGVFHIYEPAPVESSAGPLRWRLFKPPFRRRLALRYQLAERAEPLPLVVEAYNPVFTKRRVAAYLEEPRTATEPAQLGPGAEEFQEVRPYQPGDSMRFINWRAFAKTGELYVNKYLGPEVKTAIVVVDARRLRGLVLAAAAEAAEILAQRGYTVSFYVLGHGPAREVPRSFTPACSGSPNCGDVTVYVGSLRDVCVVLRCPKTYYIDAAASNPLVAIRRLGLYKELKSAGAVVLKEAKELARAL
jgi:Uncharacterized conserved protein (some members contain a von Willebrand factor type A (vWA) domain)